MRAILTITFFSSLLASALGCGGGAVAPAGATALAASPSASAVALPTETPPHTPVRLVAKHASVRNLAIDDGWLYWTTDKGLVERMQPRGSATTTIADFASHDERGLVVAHGDVYGALTASNGSQILHTNADHGGGKLDPAGTGPTRYWAFMAVDRAHLVWAFIDRGGRLVISVLDAGKTEARALPPIAMNAPGTHPSLGPNDVYFCNGGTVYGVALATGKVTPVLSLPAGDHRIVDFTIGNGHVYAAAWEAAGGSEEAVRSTTIFAAPLEGGAPSVLFSEGARNVYDLATDGTSVYFLDRPLANDANKAPDGRILRLPVAGGAPLALVDHLDRLQHVALGASAVFYSVDDPSSDTSDLFWIGK